MKLLIVLNMRGTAMGLLGQAMAETGSEIQYCAPFCGEKLPASPNGYDGLVIMGGEQNALNDADHPYFPELLELIRSFEAMDKAVLGICLGSQLIARAFGAENHVGTAPEFSWSEVALTADGVADPLMTDLSSAFRQFQWHDDTFSLPDRAVRLASSRVAENQAYRIGRACYGIQFHSEAGRRLVFDWSVMFRDILLEHRPEWLENLHAEAEHHAPACDDNGLRLLKNWLQMVTV